MFVKEKKMPKEINVNAIAAKWQPLTNIVKLRDWCVYRNMFSAPTTIFFLLYCHA